MCIRDRGESSACTELVLAWREGSAATSLSAEGQHKAYNKHVEAWREGVLRSYEEERRPVAVANTALSIANWEQTLLVRPRCSFCTC